MRTNKISIFIAIVLSALVAASCDEKEVFTNPEEMNFASADFSVSVKERRGYMDFQYSIPQEDAPVLTYWNTVTVNAESGDPEFDGVNVSSSNPSVISVSRTDNPAVYTLTYHSDGSADIRIWNSKKEETFRITSQYAIELEGLLMRVDGREFLVKADSSLPSPYSDDSPYEWTIDRFTDDMVCFDETVLDEMYKVEIVGIVPENCSWRGIEKIMLLNGGTYGSDCSNWIDPEHKGGSLYTKNSIRDVSEISNKSVMYRRYTTEQGTTFNARFLIVTFRTNCRDFTSPQKDVRFSTAICVMKTRC